MACARGAARVLSRSLDPTSGNGSGSASSSDRAELGSSMSWRALLEGGEDSGQELLPTSKPVASRWTPAREFFRDATFRRSACGRNSSVASCFLLGALALSAVVGLAPQPRWVSKSVGHFMRAFKRGAFVRYQGYNCWPENGGDPLSLQLDALEGVDLDDCKLACKRHTECEGALFDASVSVGTCWLRKNIELSMCQQGTALDLWLRPVEAFRHNSSTSSQHAGESRTARSGHGSARAAGEERAQEHGSRSREEAARAESKEGKDSEEEGGHQKRGRDSSSSGDRTVMTADFLVNRSENQSGTETAEKGEEKAPKSSAEERAKAETKLVVAAAGNETLMHGYRTVMTADFLVNRSENQSGTETVEKGEEKAPKSSAEERAKTETKLVVAAAGNETLMHGYRCSPGNGAEALPGHEKEEDISSFEGCREACREEKRCEAVAFRHASGSSASTHSGSCWLRFRLVLAKCEEDKAWVVWVKPSKEEGGGNGHGHAEEDEASDELVSQTSSQKPSSFTHHSGLACFLGGAAEPSPVIQPIRVLSTDDCRHACGQEPGCAAFVAPRGRGKRKSECHFHRNASLSHCKPDADWDLWTKNGSHNPKQVESAKRKPKLKRKFYHMKGYNCWSVNASTPVPKREAAIKNSTPLECKLACQEEEECEGFIAGVGAQQGSCWLRRGVVLPQCGSAPRRNGREWDFFQLASEPPEQGRRKPSGAPVQDFYMYRAAADGMVGKYPFGNINTGNMDGVMWYLMNEIVSDYSHGTRCPRRFNISKIHRFRVWTRATHELEAEGMNFGVRFAYDQGHCGGRCFGGNVCTGEGDCVSHYDKYGFVVGCNRFADRYPFPEVKTSAPGGVWYSLPLDGRCTGNITGEKDCTWSYEHAGEISIEELEDMAPGHLNCCNGKCTDFWHGQFSSGTTSWRVGAAQWLFKKKYPDMPKDLATPTCDFDRDKWYAWDPWPRQDPWR